MHLFCTLKTVAQFENPCTLWDSTVHCRVHNTSTMAHILCQMNPIYTLTSYTFITHILVIWHLRLRLIHELLLSCFTIYILCAFLIFPILKTKIKIHFHFIIPCSFTNALSSAQLTVFKKDLRRKGNVFVWRVLEKL
jgi:hypothetical protein